MSPVSYDTRIENPFKFAATRVNYHMPGMESSPIVVSLSTRKRVSTFMGRNIDSHPSTFSTAVCGSVHLIASSELCVLSSLHTALLQRALRALWRLSPFQPKT